MDQCGGGCCGPCGRCHRLNELTGLAARRLEGQPTAPQERVPRERKFDVRHGRVVGLSGPLAAGKTTTAEILASLGYFHIRIREVLRPLLPQGESGTRAELQQLGLRVREERGQAWLYTQALAATPQDVSLVVIDALRFGEDYRIFHDLFGQRFEHVHVTSDSSTRRSRYELRGGSGQEYDLATIHPVELDIPSLAAVSQRTIVNEGSVDDLKVAVVALFTDR